MAQDSALLSKAVQLLDEAIETLERLKVSKGSQSSARALLVKLKRARQYMLDELKQPDPDPFRVAAELISAVRWLGELVINNIQYNLIRLVVGMKCRRESGSWARAQVLPLAGRPQAEGARPADRSVCLLSLSY